MVPGQTPLEQIFSEELKIAGEDGASEGVIRAYRKMSLGSLHALNPAKLPHDLSALHVMVQACELYAYVMYMAGFGGIKLTFSEKGLGETIELLNWCQAFFSHTAFIAPDLPPSFEDQVDVRKHAQACSADLAAIVAKLQDSGMPDADERAEGVTGDGEATAVTITTDTFVSLAKALLVIIYTWMDEPTREAFRVRFVRDYEEAQELRKLVPELFPGMDQSEDPEREQRREIMTAVAVAKPAATARRKRAPRGAARPIPPKGKGARRRTKAKGKTK